MNPYVVQIDKFVSSLDKLSYAFLRMDEDKNMITEEACREIREDVKERVCRGCERKKVCHGVDMLQEVLYAIEKYGAAKGGWLAFKRLMRCHPFTKRDTFDPVP